MAFWTSGTGVAHEFAPHLYGSGWNEVAGIYVFGTLLADGGCNPVLYVGQCGSFKTRMCQHDRWEEAERRGATHVFAKVVPLQADRDVLEQAMIRALNPPMNTHHMGLLAQFAR